jgi:AcrR family transcriptional regulator
MLAAVRVTRGALYCHFDNKEALGYAVVDEVLASISREKWVWPLQNARNPIDALVCIVQGTSCRREDLECGCSLNNLSQEMCPLMRGSEEGQRRFVETGTVQSPQRSAKDRNAG